MNSTAHVTEPPAPARGGSAGRRQAVPGSCHSRRRTGVRTAHLAGLALILAGLAPLAAPALAAAASADAAPAAAPADQADDAVVGQILQMLRGGVAEPVIVIWLDKSGKRPAAMSSHDVVALHQAGASDALLKRLVETSGAGPEGRQAAPEAQKPEPGAHQPKPSPRQDAGTAAPAGGRPETPAGPAPAPTPAPAQPGGSPVPLAPGSAAAAAGATAPAAGGASAPEAAGGTAKLRLAVTYRPVSLDEGQLVAERWLLYAYVDGRFVASVKPGPVLMPLGARAFERELPAGRHLLRLTQERHPRYNSARGYLSSVRVDPSEFPFELRPGTTTEIKIHFGDKSFRHPGPVAVHVEQDGKEVAHSEPPAPNPEAWPALCEDIPAALPPGAKLPAPARRELAGCVHWAALWPGLDAVPSRDEVRAEIERAGQAPRAARTE